MIRFRIMVTDIWNHFSLDIGIPSQKWIIVNFLGPLVLLGREGGRLSHVFFVILIGRKLILSKFKLTVYR